MSEILLWADLRNRQLGVRFRRQEPIGPFIVDFACRSHRIVIELDGTSHWGEEAAAADEARDRWLEQNGWRVLRYADIEVYQERDGVVADILRALGREIYVE